MDQKVLPTCVTAGQTSLLKSHFRYYLYCEALSDPSAQHCTHATPNNHHSLHRAAFTYSPVSIFYSPRWEDPVILTGPKVDGWISPPYPILISWNSNGRLRRVGTCACNVRNASVHSDPSCTPFCWGNESEAMEVIYNKLLLWNWKLCPKSPITLLEKCLTQKQPW